MVADLAHRCVRLNPHFGAEAAVRSPGLVLIDEVDMHLHPAWQQSVLAALRRAFKNMQFIVTTHSPQVISTVPARCIRILDGAAVASAPPGTQGAESSRVLKRHAVAAVLHHDPLVLAPRVRRGAGGHRVRRVT
jgi:predicted ATP-binding protein involved in virulence